MKRSHLLLGAALALTSVWAVAQEAPESLLPPGFDRPAPKASQARVPASPPPAVSNAAPAGNAPRIAAEPLIQTLPAGPDSAGKPGLPANLKLPSLADIERLSPDELTELLGLKPQSDIPPAARRAMKQMGSIDQSEGGLPAGGLAGQNVSLVRASFEGNKGVLVSRWGHILLRRALASRLDVPAGMNPADFVAMRAALLVRMGEGEAARALVQDIDTGNYTPALTQAAVDAYVATADFTGICPAVLLQGGARKDAQWQILRAICAAFQGDGNSAMAQLDGAMARGVMPRIDILLAQKYAGAAGKARRAVTIEWDGVTDMTPWRYAMTLAVGLEPPASLMRGTPARYDYIAATAPMLGLESRAAAAERAGGAGVLSSAAMVDLYGQIAAQDDISGDWSARADQLRLAYVADLPKSRLEAMRDLWDSAPGETQRYSRQVLTAYAAARLPVDSDFSEDAGPLIASMLSAGLDRNAMRWAPVSDVGSQAWALLALVAPTRTNPVAEGALTSFHDIDDSEGARKSAFLLAGLAGLGRVTPQVARSFAGTLEIDLSRQSRWSRLIDQAAQVDNQALVALLAGIGMQGSGWDKMTPRHLYHIVSALRDVGLEAEARMIAAEAVARG